MHAYCARPEHRRTSAPSCVSANNPQIRLSMSQHRTEGQVARALRGFGVDLDRTVSLIIDMQRDFLETSQKNMPACAND